MEPKENQREKEQEVEKGFMSWWSIIKDVGAVTSGAVHGNPTTNAGTEALFAISYGGPKKKKKRGKKHGKNSN